MHLVGADGVDQGFKSFGPATSRDDAPPGRSERASGGFADAGRCSSDESRLAHTVPFESLSKARRL
jgi:hypothetical protein